MLACIPNRKSYHRFNARWYKVKQRQSSGLPCGPGWPPKPGSPLSPLAPLSPGRPEPPGKPGSPLEPVGKVHIDTTLASVTTHRHGFDYETFTVTKQSLRGH